jgi:hypothetical protein
MRPKKYGVRPVSNVCGEPFNSVEEAWSWAVAGASARLAGARTIAGMAQIDRPCEPFDIIRLVWTLHRQRRLSQQQVRALLEEDCHSETIDVGAQAGRDYRLLDQALEILVNPLQQKGILS